MKTKGYLTAIAIGVIMLFASVALYAGTTVPDVIKMENDYEHEKAIVEFSHKKHAEDYAAANPKLYKNKCGECHHDENGNPLSDLKAGDNVQKCIECHKKPGEVPKDVKKEWRTKKIKKKEKDKLSLEWHAEALHDNCRTCHKKWNKANKSKAAPTTCTKCHPKKEN